MTVTRDEPAITLAEAQELDKRLGYPKFNVTQADGVAVQMSLGLLLYNYMPTKAQKDALVALTASTGTAGKIEILEDPANGTNKVTIQPVASLTADRTITLPNEDVDLSTVNLLTPASAAASAKLELAEDTDNGVNKATIQPVASLTADRTVTLPDADVDLADVNSNAAEFAAIASTDLGVTKHVKIVCAGGSTANYDKTLPTGTWEFVDGWGVNQGTGTTSDTIQFAKDTGGNITNAIDMSGGDKTIGRAGEIDDANFTLIGGTDALRVIQTDGSGSDCPVVAAHALLRRVA